MYGVLLESIVAFIRKTYGEEQWILIKKTARLDQENFSAHQVYAETLIPKIVDACHKHLGLPKEDILVAFGKSFVDFVCQYGYDKILRVVGRNFREFLNGLDNIHEYLRFTYPKLKPPSFFCESETPTGLVLHYRSRRRYNGFQYYVIGQLKGVGRTLFKQDVSVSVLKSEMAGNTMHVIYQLKFDNSEFRSMTLPASMMANLPLRMDIFYDLFPFHVLFDRELIIQSTGRSLRAVMDDIIGYDVSQVFTLKKPLINFTWEAITSRTNSMFELSSIDPIRGKEQIQNQVDYWGDNDNGQKKKRTSVVSIEEDGVGTFLRLKGQMLHIGEWDYILFLGTAVLPDIESLLSAGLYLNDLSMHDNSRELVLSGAQQGIELKLVLKQEEARSKQLNETVRKLENETKRSRDLLCKLVPRHLANKIHGDREEDGSPRGVGLDEEVVDLAPQAVIFICSIMTSQTGEQMKDLEKEMRPAVTQLAAMHKQVEILMERHGFYRIETTSSSLMAVSGIGGSTDAAEESAFALSRKVLAFAKTFPEISVRVCLHGGPTIYALVGSRFPRLCIFGPNVLVARSLQKFAESQGEHGLLLATQDVTAKMGRDAVNSLKTGPEVPYKDGHIKTFVMQA